MVNTGTGWSVTLNGIPGVYRLGYLVEHNYGMGLGDGRHSATGA